MLENGPGENHSPEELERMLKHNKGAAAAVDKAWPKELVTDGLFNAYGSKYGAFPFYVPIRWCQYLLQIFLAGYKHGAQRKKRKFVDSGILVVNGREYKGYHDYGRHQGSHNRVRARQRQLKNTTLFERDQLDQIRVDVTWMDKLVNRVEQLTGH